MDDASGPLSGQGEAAASNPQDELNSAALRYTDQCQNRQCVVLSESQPRVLIGRSDSCDVVIDGDAMMSREHALVERVGTRWYISDNMSSHGTYVNRERVGEHRRRLEPNDRLVLGCTVLTFRPATPRLNEVPGTRQGPGTPQRVTITPAQERVLRALCAPLLADPDAAPESNRQIGKVLHIGEDAVRDHLHVLFEKFGVQNFPDREKRHRLARRALRLGQI